MLGWGCCRRRLWQFLDAPGTVEMPYNDPYAASAEYEAVVDAHMAAQSPGSSDPATMVRCVDPFGRCSLVVFDCLQQRWYIMSANIELEGAEREFLSAKLRASVEGVW